MLEQFRLGQEIIKAQFRIRSKDGGICWVDCRGRVVEDERGSKWVHAVMIDDTEAQNQKQEYWEKSMRDSLTGLFNRDAAVQSVNRYMQDGSRAPEGALPGFLTARIWWAGLAVTSSWYFQNSSPAGKKS